jgi:hypothetical protein
MRRIRSIDLSDELRRCGFYDGWDRKVMNRRLSSNKEYRDAYLEGRAKSPRCLPRQEGD